MRKSGILIINVFIIIFFFCVSAFSKTNDQDVIRQIAKKFLSRKSVIHTQTLKKQIAYEIDTIESLKDPGDSTVLIHVVKIHPKGFLLISPYTNGNPIIGYSFHSNWNGNISKKHPLYTLLMLNRNKRRDNHSQSYPLDYPTNSFESKSDLNTDDYDISQVFSFPEYYTETGGWVETTWKQSAPCNDFCPMDTSVDKRSMVGCVALALAQIVNFHKYLGLLGTYPYLTEENYRYTDNFSQRINIDEDSLLFKFPNFLTLNSYLNKIGMKYMSGNNELTDQEKAALCFACGIVLKMNYSWKNGSGLYDYQSIARPIVEKLGYANADFYGYDDEFKNQLIENILNGLPAIVIIKLPDTKHAIIADGYSTDGYIHLNFGWGDASPDPIREVKWQIFDESLPYNCEDIVSGILNIKTYELPFDLRVTADKSFLHFDDAYTKKSSGDHIRITNYGTLYSSIRYVITTNNFDFSHSDGWPKYEPKPLEPGGTHDIWLNFQPEILGEIRGRFQVIAKYQPGRECVYDFLNINLEGRGKPGTIVNPGPILGEWRSQVSSPYFIEGDIYIPEGEKLFIEAGSQIVFRGPYQFSISQNAQLIAKGSKTDSIIFTAEDIDEGWQGILFKDSGDDDTLAYCVLSHANRTATSTLSRGGVISIDDSSPTITHSRIANNKTFLNGGGLYLANSNAFITDTRFEANISPINGGALFMDNSSPTILKTIFCNNQASCGGAIYATKSSPTFTNVTIADNKALTNGGAIALGKECQIEIENAIIWANEAQHGSTLAITTTSNLGMISFDYSNIDTTDNWLYQGSQAPIEWKKGILCTDPLFTNQFNCIYTLQEESPCIDAGNPDTSYNDTEDCNKSGYALIPAMGTVSNDMGAYGGHGSGLWLKMDEKIAFVPNAYVLYQNYPNPFNPKTVISWNVGATRESPIHVDLSIYNVLGQKVTTLVAGKQKAGFHSVEWDASGLASGVYYYKIQAGEFVDTKKLVLLR